MQYKNRKYLGVRLKRCEVGQFSGFWAWWQSIEQRTAWSKSSLTWSVENLTFIRLLQKLDQVHFSKLDPICSCETKNNESDKSKNRVTKTCLKPARRATPLLSTGWAACQEKIKNLQLENLSDILFGSETTSVRCW